MLTPVQNKAAPQSAPAVAVVGLIAVCVLFASVAVDDKPNTELNSIRVLPDGRMLSTDTKNQRVVIVSRWECRQLSHTRHTTTPVPLTRVA